MNWDSHIRAALALATAARLAGEDPFGAVLLDPDGQQVAAARDESLAKADPTAHAERLLLSRYCSAERRITLVGYTIVSSAEPCVMCAGAAHWAKVSRIVYSVRQTNLQQMSTGRSKPSASSMANQLAYELVGPKLEAEGLQVFRDFDWRRKADRLVKQE